MRLTNKLCAQHLGWWFKQQWKRAGQRMPIETNTKEELEKMGIQVIDAKAVLRNTRPRKEFPALERQMPISDTSEQSLPAYVLRDENVLLAGVPQGQVLLKTIKLDTLPERMEKKMDKVKISSITDENIRTAIIASHLLDAEQKKTAVVKISERPAFVTPRNYGITDERKMSLLSAKLLLECEKLAGRLTNSQHRISNNLKFKLNLVKGQDKLQMDFNVETLITSKQSIMPVGDVIEQDIPDIHPLNSTISIPISTTYNEMTQYPIHPNSSFANPHTLILHFSPLSVKNLHETPVTDNQFQARNMLKAFSVAASRAKQMYGENIGNLEKPIVVQSIHSDGRLFHFGVFQLNTLNIDGREGLKNYWFQKDTMSLFDECRYNMGRPILLGYNPNIMKYLFIFYSNN